MFILGMMNSANVLKPFIQVKETSKDGSVTKLKDGSEIHWIINQTKTVFTNKIG